MIDFLRSISFTKKEIKVIIFSVSLLTSGLVIKFYKHLIYGDDAGKYDYSRTDNEFKKLTLSEIPGSGNDSNESNAEIKLLQKLLNAEDSGARVPDSVKKSEEYAYTGEKININTATKEELTELPGIGESTAEKIIIYRDERKKLNRAEELMNVKGIGPAKFKKLKDLIKTE